ncbi:hypothetical protein D3C77_214460 [compost metagenome]
MKVILDKEGKLINIGAWDFMVSHGENGEMAITNPIPEGAYEAEVDIAFCKNGRAFLADDYYNLRKAEYPDIGDQLDALFRAGAFPPEMAEEIQAVKDKYPKPDEA